MKSAAWSNGRRRSCGRQGRRPRSARAWRRTAAGTRVARLNTSRGVRVWDTRAWETPGSSRRFSHRSMRGYPFNRRRAWKTLTGPPHQTMLARIFLDILAFRFGISGQ